MSQGEKGQAKHQGGDIFEQKLGKMNLKADSSPTVVPPDQKVSVTKEMSWENGSLDRLGRKSKRSANNKTVLTLNFEVLQCLPFL